MAANSPTEIRSKAARLEKRATDFVKFCMVLVVIVWITLAQRDHIAGQCVQHGTFTVAGNSYRCEPMGSAAP